MGFADKTHWIGVFFLFAASILLLITTISAPIWNSVSLLHVTLKPATGLHHESLSFGTFGYCILNMPPHGDDLCTRRHIGYDPAYVIAQADHTNINEIEAGTSDALTRVMVLHPIECGLAFLAFLLAVGHGMIGSLAGALVALVAWVLVLITLATDFSLFGILHHHVNNDGSGSHASFGSAIWCELAAFVLLFFGMIIVFFTCCAHRKERRRVAKSEADAQAAPAPRKKKFGIF